ncbi:hypothetical protein DCM91_15575 [Chitinophaga costaii]|nr:hypothetical protein DCM91_15575 [Chitinophaga costaii]
MHAQAPFSFFIIIIKIYNIIFYLSLHRHDLLFIVPIDSRHMPYHKQLKVNRFYLECFQKAIFFFGQFLKKVIFVKHSSKMYFY